jgi:histidinol-phosphate phosphatase family protein
MTKVVFLDRDGVINVFPGNGNYVTRVKDMQFIPGSLLAIRALAEAGYAIFVISNQAGVGKGVFSNDQLNSITQKMNADIEQAGGKITKVYYCTHRPDVGCSCRKPGIGSICKALQSMNKSIRSAKNAYFVGDTKADIETGFNAGCKTIFVLSGRENRRYMRSWIVQPDYVARNLYEAVKIILGDGKKRLACRHRPIRRLR